MKVFSTKYTSRGEVEQIIKIWWRFLALPMEIIGIIFVAISWIIRDWWFFAFGVLFIGISLFVHLQIQLVSIDLNIAYNKDYTNKEAKE